MKKVMFFILGIVGIFAGTPALLATAATGTIKDKELRFVLQNDLYETHFIANITVSPSKICPDKLAGTASEFMTYVQGKLVLSGLKLLGSVGTRKKQPYTQAPLSFYSMKLVDYNYPYIDISITLETKDKKLQTVTTTVKLGVTLEKGIQTFSPNVVALQIQQKKLRKGMELTKLSEKTVREKILMKEYQKNINTGISLQLLKPCIKVK